jgi:hypothetical protein
VTFLNRLEHVGNLRRKRVGELAMVLRRVRDERKERRVCAVKRTVVALYSVREPCALKVDPPILESRIAPCLSWFVADDDACDALRLLIRGSLCKCGKLACVLALERRALTEELPDLDHPLSTRRSRCQREDTHIGEEIELGLGEGRQTLDLIL